MIFQAYLHVRRPGIERVLDEFFDARGEVEHHLSRTDSVHGGGVDGSYGARAGEDVVAVPVVVIVGRHGRRRRE